MSRTDLQDYSRTVGAVLEVMAICDACREAHTIARLQDVLTSVGDENDLPFNDPDELVFVRVPVALAGPGVRGEMQEVYPELRQTCRIAQSAACAGATRFVVGRGVASGSFAALDCGHVDLRHQSPRLP
jgi:hypothetical protein